MIVSLIKGKIMIKIGRKALMKATNKGNHYRGV